MVFVDLQKGYDRVSREFIRWCLRKKCVPGGMFRVYNLYTRTVKLLYRLEEGIYSTFTQDSDCIKGLR